MFCPSCAHSNPDTAGYCGACGATLPAMAGAPPPQQPYGTPYGAPYANPYPPMAMMQTRTSGMAIAGFVLSFFCGLLGLIFSILGYNECKNSHGAVTGQGLAIAGIVISSVNMLLGLLMAMAG